MIFLWFTTKIIIIKISYPLQRFVFKSTCRIQDTGLGIIYELYDNIFTNTQFQGMHHQRSPEPAAVICDSWVNDASTPEIKGNLGPGCSMPVSYFQNYKNKMKKIKEAGLRADVQTVNLESENYMIKRDDLTLSFDEDSLSDHGTLFLYLMRSFLASLSQYLVILG